MVLIVLAAALLLAPRAGDPTPRRPVEAAPGPLLESDVAPLAGGGTAPSPLAVRMEDPRDVVHLDFKHPPGSGLLFDVDTGRVLWRHRPTRVLPIASLTKMMTALVVADRLPDGARAKITKEVLSYTGSGVGLLPRGKKIQVRTLLYGLLLPSGNDAAIALAPAGRGSQRALRGVDEPRARSDGSRLHALLVGRAGSRTRATTRARRTWRRSRGRSCASRGWPRSSAAARPSAVPDQGPQALPLQQQPTAAGGLQGHHRRQDRLHRRGRPLPRGDGAPRTDPARRRAAATPRPGRQAERLLDRGFARFTSRSGSRSPARACG